eukprot:12705542-Alexandrium_andersonii.AAC.1
MCIRDRRPPRTRVAARRAPTREGGEPTHAAESRSAAADRPRQQPTAHKQRPAGAAAEAAAARAAAAEQLPATRGAGAGAAAAADSAPRGGGWTHHRAAAATHGGWQPREPHVGGKTGPPRSSRAQAAADRPQ